MRTERVALIGFGAIGRTVAQELLKRGDGPQPVAVLVRSHQAAAARMALPESVRIVTHIQYLRGLDPDLVVECAGQGAVRDYARDILAAGWPLMLVSTGALAEPGFLDGLRAAAIGGGRLLIPAGAIAGLDGLGALKIAGLTSVTYSSTKPPQAWKNTPAEEMAALHQLTQPTVFFDGSAREAALRFPKNANLAATVALTGLGLDATRVQLIADPGAHGNIGRIEAESVIGRMRVVMDGVASTNPKTSASTAFSLVHAIASRSAWLTI
ncbi:MAG: aspartate dehydrogenase [Beijerinckiaceae bacterium]